MNKEIALIIGVGAATGEAVCRAWAERFTLILVARSEAVIHRLAEELPSAHALTCDVSDRDQWGETLAEIKQTWGIPKRILVNVECAPWGAYTDLSLDVLNQSFDVNVISVMQMVQVLFPDPDQITGTRVMISSSPAAYNPPPRFLGLAPSRVAQRVIAELLDANLRKAGLAFSVFSINGAIDEPMMRAAYPDQPTSFFIQPDDIATAMTAVFESDTFELAAEIRGESSFA